MSFVTNPEESDTDSRSDTDCLDLDLELYDAKDRLVAQDTDPDDVPTLTATPTSTGQYRIRVT